LVDRGAWLKYSRSEVAMLEINADLSAGGFFLDGRRMDAASVQYGVVTVTMPSGVKRHAWCLIIQLVCDMGRSPVSSVCSHCSLKHIA